jgi:ethanolamine utilization cobalamin adenosyltransferase
MFIVFLVLLEDSCELLLFYHQFVQHRGVVDEVSALHLGVSIEVAVVFADLANSLVELIAFGIELIEEVGERLKVFDALFMAR